MILPSCDALKSTATLKIRHFYFRKLEKAVAVSGIFVEVPEEHSGKSRKTLLETFSPIAKCFKLRRDMGGVQNVWGEENVPKNALSPKIFVPLQKSFSSALSWVFRALTPKGSGKRTVQGGGPKPLFGRGVIHEVFHPPLFSSSDKIL